MDEIQEIKRFKEGIFMESKNIHESKIRERKENDEK